MDADSDHMRLMYETAVKQNPSNLDAVQYLAVWHLERHSFQQARKFFGHLVTLRPNEPDVWLCLSVCCAMAEEFQECSAALQKAEVLVDDMDDMRIKFCRALGCEKRKDYAAAMEVYMNCLNDCNAASSMGNNFNLTSGSSASADAQALPFMRELRGEIMLRIAVVKKDLGAVDQAMIMCNNILAEHCCESVRANTLCLKGLLYEIRNEFPTSEVVYRSVLQISGGHSTALERLGRVYLRYRETIPAAVQCFFKSVETNPSSHVAWYLLGRCYMATAQYSDACEAYNRAVNLNSNDPQVWCSLGVLYYAFGQYREALGMLTRALKLDCTMADAWYNVGALYDMCDQPEDAQQAYLKAKEHGLADRFAKAGMGLNPIASQAMQVISSNSSEALRPPQTGASAAPVSSSSSAPFRQHPSEHQPQHQNDQQHLQQQMDLHKQLQLQQQVMQQQMIQHHQQLSLQPLFPEHGMQHYQQPQYQHPQYHQHVPGVVPIHLQESQQQLIEDLQTINYSELIRDGDLPEHDAHF